MYSLHSSKFVRWRRRSARERERGEVILGFYTIMVEFYSKEVLRGFIPCRFLEENICVIFLIVLIVLSVILIL